MNLEHHTKPENLERYSFLWSELRLLIAALALFLGGYPPILYFFGSAGMYGLLRALLTLAWLISGAAALYLLYMWRKNHFMLFGGKVKLDMYAFIVLIVSGINLGLVGLTGNNLGMSIFPSQFMFIIGGILYLLAAYHLHKRWKAHGEKLF